MCVCEATATSPALIWINKTLDVCNVYELSRALIKTACFPSKTCVG